MERNTPGKTLTLPRGPWKPLLLLAALGFFAGVSLSLLDRSPVEIAVFRGGDRAPVYLVHLNLGRQESDSVPADLTASQRREAAGAILEGDRTTLAELARTLGTQGRYAAAPGEDGEWPWYFGGGIRALRGSLHAGPWLDGFTPFERVNLALLAKAPPPPPWTAASTTPEKPDAAPGATPVAAATTPTPQGTPGDKTAVPLQVEIRNGCGITNAADVVARAAQDAGMVVVKVGNASNFKFRKTVVDSSAGVPVALEDLLGRMGLDDGVVREAEHPVPGVDVIITVGRDYRKIREHLRD